MIPTDAQSLRRTGWESQAAIPTLRIAGLEVEALLPDGRGGGDLARMIVTEATETQTPSPGLVAKIAQGISSRRGHRIVCALTPAKATPAKVNKAKPI